ncbi:MAG: BatA domain-containing protein [Paludisphaera borealis]|uniref:BatA domain-containing protein n=1 Tax=Paludisphaera borealis TaxID=1387353 RepID=UPI002840E542|nr:BatA domain-containing protein [Paludisphaera borealis]MDR3621734.1 BatA domain-containing protein [Paludisphaera borealis]
MQFVQFGMLGALAALAIPIVIHLLFRNRPRTIELGTLQFLHVVLRENARKRKVKRRLLLALRLACVALAALMFARPFLPALEPKIGDRLVIVLIDRSASMGLTPDPSPLGKAVELARRIVDRLGPNTKLEAAVFDREVVPMKDPASELRAGLEPASGTGTDYAAALAWARDLCVRSRGTRKEIHLFTDLQRSGLDRGERVELPADVDVQIIDVGRPFPKNVAVTAVAASPSAPRPGGSTTVTAAVRNASPLPLAGVPVRLHLEFDGDERDQEKTIDLDGGAESAVVFDLKKLPAGVWRGTVRVEVEGDQLAIDDRRYLAVAVAPPAAIRILDGDPGRNGIGGETYYLRAALQLAPNGETYAKSPFELTTTDASGEGGTAVPPLEGVSAVVLANIGLLKVADATRLAAFVEAGGGLIVFTGDRFGPKAAKALADVGLGVGAVGDASRSTDLPWRLDRWETSHAVFQPFANPEHGDLHRPAFTTITPIQPSPSARVLASFRGGTPALLETSHGKGKVLWFASACDRDWGDWPRGRLYVPLVHQMAAYVSGHADGGPVRRLLAADGQAPGVSDRDGIVRIVNADPFESDSARTTPREFAGRFGFRIPDAPAMSSTDEADAVASAKPDERLRRDEVWPQLAAALLGFLLLEQFLANRTAA